MLLLLLRNIVGVRELQTVFKHILKFSKDTVTLQRQGITSLQVCEIFDHVLETS